MGWDFVCVVVVLLCYVVVFYLVNGGVWWRILNVIVVVGGLWEMVLKISGVCSEGCIWLGSFVEFWNVRRRMIVVVEVEVKVMM